MANATASKDDDGTPSQRRSSVLSRRASCDIQSQHAGNSNFPKFYEPPHQDKADKDAAHYGIRPINHGTLKFDAASAQQDAFRSVFYTDPKFIVPSPPRNLGFSQLSLAAFVFLILYAYRSLKATGS